MPRNRNFSFDVALEPGLVRDSDITDTYVGYSAADGRTALTFGDVELVNGRRAVSGGWRQRYGYGSPLMADDSSIPWSLSPLRGGLAATRAGELIAFTTGQVLGTGLNWVHRPRMVQHDRDVLIAGGADLIKYDSKMEVTRVAGDVPTPPVLTDAPVPTSGKGHLIKGGYVYGITYATTGGETDISIWDMVLATTKLTTMEISLPRAPKDPRITGINLYRATSSSGQNRSDWVLIFQETNLGGCVYADFGQAKIIKRNPTGPTSSKAPSGVKYVASINDYVVVAGHHQYEIAWTFPGNSDLWPILNVANVALSSGQVRGLGASQDRLYVFCEHAIEIWGLQQVGNSVVFTRRHSIPVGVLAPDSIVRNNGEYLFLSNDLRVYILATNFQVRSLSDKVQRLFSDLTKPELVYAMAFTRDSTIRFFSKEDDKCITLDVRYPAWSTDEGPTRTMLPLESYCEVDGQSYVAVLGERGVFRWGSEYLTDNGTAIRVRRTLRMILSQSGRTVRVKRLRLRAPGSIETGEADVRWTLDGSSAERHNLTDGDVENGHSYYDFWGLGVGREIEIEVDESTSGALAVSHAHLSLKELGR